MLAARHNISDGGRSDRARRENGELKAAIQRHSHDHQDPLSFQRGLSQVACSPSPTQAGGSAVASPMRGAKAAPSPTHCAIAAPAPTSGAAVGALRHDRARATSSERHRVEQLAPTALECSLADLWSAVGLRNQIATAVQLHKPRSTSTPRSEDGDGEANGGWR